MPTNITMKGVVFAAPTAPGYTPGARVVVTAVVQFSDVQLTAIDAVSGSAISVASVAVTNVKYKLTTNTNPQEVTAPATTNTVQVGVVQQENRLDGKRTITAALTDKSGNSYHTGTVQLAAFETLGTVWESTSGDPDEAATSEPGYGLYVESWDDKNFDGGIRGQDHKRVFAAAPSVGWSGADTTVADTLMADTKLSLRWVGYVRIPAAGSRRFLLTSRYGSDVGLWLDDVRLVNHSGEPPSDTGFFNDVTPYTEYTEFQMVRIRIDYEGTSNAHAVKLEYQPLGGTPEVVPTAQLYSGPQVGTIDVVPEPDQSRWYIESVNRYQES